jgi:hypothetical protein
MKHSITRRLIRSGAAPAIWLAVLAAGSATVLAADSSAPAGTAAEDAAARTRLLEMAEFMARAPGLRVTMRSSYDAIQEDGRRVEFGERRTIMLQRPDKLRVEVERSDGEKGGVVFDGRAITAFNARENVYARVERAGTLDDTLVYMVRDLKATLPLARLFTTFAATDLGRRATTVDFVEECTLFDVPTEHLSVRSAEVDLQVWIAKGAAPLPRRVVITYKNAPGEPQFRADLYDWDAAPKVGADAFAFVPPAGAERIKYLAPRPKDKAPAASGGEPL